MLWDSIMVHWKSITEVCEFYRVGYRPYKPPLRSVSDSISFCYKPIPALYDQHGQL